MPRTVIVGIDNSDFADHAFEFYVKHVHLRDDVIILVHVSEYMSLVQAPSSLTDPVVVKGLIEEEEKKVDDLIKKYSEKLKVHHLGGKVKHLAGRSGECIILTAKDEKADLIVVGTRGLGKLRRTLLGSVSDYVLHHSHIPVMVACGKHGRKHSESHPSEN